jgi:hypothetical protein
MRQSMRFRFLQQVKNLLPLNTRKTFEKVCNGVTGLQMIEETLNRYPGPSKNLEGWLEAVSARTPVMPIGDGFGGLIADFDTF